MYWMQVESRTVGRLLGRLLFCPHLKHNSTAKLSDHCYDERRSRKQLRALGVVSEYMMS